jgi:hypothetical protein
MNCLSLDHSESEVRDLKVGIAKKGCRWLVLKVPQDLRQPAFSRVPEQAIARIKTSLPCFSQEDMQILAQVFSPSS